MHSSCRRHLQLHWSYSAKPDQGTLEPAAILEALVSPTLRFLLAAWCSSELPSMWSNNTPRQQWWLWWCRGHRQKNVLILRPQGNAAAAALDRQHHFALTQLQHQQRPAKRKAVGGFFQVWASIHQHGLQPNQCLNLVLTYPADAGAYQFSCIDSAVYIQIVTKKDDEPKSCWQQNRLMFLHDLYLKNGPSEKPQNKYVYILAAWI